MKHVALALLTTVALQEYPPAFPRDGVTKVFENERVVVWDARWTAGRPTAMHQHSLDLVGVILQGGRTRQTFPDGSTRESPQLSSTGNVVFQPKGVIHIEEGLVDGARTIGIELKDVSAPTLSENPDLPRAFPRTGAALLLENERVAIWDSRRVSGEPLELHVHDRDAVVVPIEAGHLRFTRADGQVRSIRHEFGKVTFESRDAAHVEEAVEGSPRVIVVELK